MSDGYKPFSQSLYDSSDHASKIAAVKFLVSTGNFELKIPLEYQLDKKNEMYQDGDIILHCIRKKKDYIVEVEQKLEDWNHHGKWGTTKKGYVKFYSTITIPHRKKKSKSSLYIMFNLHFDTLAIMLTKDIFASKVITKPTKYTSNEPFYDVLLEKANFYTLSNDAWVKINANGSPRG